MSIFSSLESIRDLYRTGQLDGLDSFEGIQLTHRDDAYDGGGAYVVLTFDALRLPPGVFAEIDGDTYGEMHGIRIYRDADK